MMVFTLIGNKKGRAYALPFLFPIITCINKIWLAIMLMEHIGLIRLYIVLLINRSGGISIG
ncbi:hypothetical protein D7D81_11160 [Halocella sp. SP3-1]|nr:hypothetical protein D7D81_11160 [Halocella sp. SP3-1]